MGDQNVGKLEEEAKKRKERLKALREQRKGGEPASKKEKVELPKPSELKLRNYEPVTDDLKVAKLENAKPGVVDEHVKEQVEGQAPTPTVIDEVDLLNLAPRKPDWDLKRDIKSKLERLERRTQRAITELIRERLKESAKNDTSNLAEVPDAPKDGYDSD